MVASLHCALRAAPVPADTAGFWGGALQATTITTNLATPLRAAASAPVPRPTGPGRRHASRRDIEGAADDPRGGAGSEGQVGRGARPQLGRSETKAGTSQRCSREAAEAAAGSRAAADADRGGATRCDPLTSTRRSCSFDARRRRRRRCSTGRHAVRAGRCWRRASRRRASRHHADRRCGS